MLLKGDRVFMCGVWVLRRFFTTPNKRCNAPNRGTILKSLPIYAIMR